MKISKILATTILLPALFGGTVFAITADEINRLSSEEVQSLSQDQVMEYANISPEFREKFFTPVKGDITFVKKTPGVYDPDMLVIDKSWESVSNGVAAIDQIVNLASKIWTIIKDNAPVATAKTTYATAVPNGINSWADLSGWQEPVSQGYRIAYQNLYGINMVDFYFNVMYTYGGSYDGKGLYLTGVTVVPTAISVAWGITFNLSAEVPDSTVYNVGTKQNPMAAMQLVMKYEVKGPFQYFGKSFVFYIRGDGFCKELTDTVRSKSLADIKTVRELPAPNVK